MTECMLLSYNFQIREGLSEFLDSGGGIRVRIQWEHNYLLFQATFNQYDEVARFHNIQMRYNCHSND